MYTYIVFLYENVFYIYTYVHTYIHIYSHIYTTALCIQNFLSFLKIHFMNCNTNMYTSVRSLWHISRWYASASVTLCWLRRRKRKRLASPSTRYVEINRISYKIYLPLSVLCPMIVHFPGGRSYQSGR